MSGPEKRACVLRLLVCGCVLTAAALIDRHAEKLPFAADAAEVFSFVGRGIAGETEFGAIQEVLSIPELPQTTNETDTVRETVVPAETARDAE